MAASELNLSVDDTIIEKNPQKPSLNVNFDVSDPATIASSTYNLINRPRYVPKILEKSLQLQKVLKPKTKVKHRYFSNAEKIDESNQRDLFKERSPFVYPNDLENFAHQVMIKAWRQGQRVKELEKKIYSKTSYHTRQHEDLLNRLYVKEPEITTMKSVLDLDKQFFKVIAGRPIPDKLDVKTYIQTIREVLKIKIINGYREDDIMLIEEKLLLEQKMIDEIKENYQRYVNMFEEFLYNDHTYSMKLLRQSELEANEAYNKYEEYKALSKEYAALKSMLYNSEEKWRNCKMYQKFLHLISPLSWRRENPLDQNENDTEDESDVSSIFGKYRLGTVDESVSLENLIGEFLSADVTESEPRLYFKTPEELLNVFRFMEIQNLNSLLHSEELAGPLEAVREGMKNAEMAFSNEITTLQETINKLENGIVWEEERTKYLEKLAHELIDGEFKRLTIDEDVLNLHVFVEDVYETCVGPNDANLTMVDMMRGVEEKYRSELLKLDKMPSDQVTKLESGFYAEEARAMKMAEKAARELLELERLTSKMFGAYTAPFYKTQKDLKWRSPPKNPPKPVPVPPRQLTEDEVEYLDFFTEYCSRTDSLVDYGIDTKQQSKTSPQEQPEGEKKDINDTQELQT